MKQTTLTVTENTRLADGIYRLRLAGDTSAITAPGQFVNLKLSGFFLRRPISVCDWSDGELTLIYKVLGHGTEAMTGMAPGTELDVLTGLGNGLRCVPQRGTPPAGGRRRGHPAAVRPCQAADRTG